MRDSEAPELLSLLRPLRMMYSSWSETSPSSALRFRLVAEKKHSLDSRLQRTQGGSCGLSTLPKSQRTLRRRQGMQA